MVTAELDPLSGSVRSDLEGEDPVLSASAQHFFGAGNTREGKRVRPVLVLLMGMGFHYHYIREPPTGKAAEELLGKAHITVNKNAIPNDPEKPFVTSGIRIGSPAMTTRGFKEEESETLANLIADLLDAPGSEEVLESVRKSVGELTEKFPVYVK